MPRIVRNFWLELSVDGSKSNVETGPRAKDGGFDLTILMRDKGGIIRPMSIRGYVDREGKLQLVAETKDGDHIIRVSTER